MINNSFLYKLSNPRSSLFSSFLRESRQLDLNVCWYPSAGFDFRLLLYLSDQYNIYCNSAISKEHRSPDIFILTDYYTSPNFLKDSILYEDKYTKISVIDSEKLMPLNMRYSLELVNLNQDRRYNNVTFVQALVESKQLGTFKAPFIYINTINEYFCVDFLIKNQANVSHIVHIRYGGGCGGGGYASGAWLNNVLGLLKTEVYITDNHENFQSGDDAFLSQFPELKLQKIPTKKLFRTIPSKDWSNHGDISWYMIDN